MTIGSQHPPHIHGSSCSKCLVDDQYFDVPQAHVLMRDHFVCVSCHIFPRFIEHCGTHCPCRAFQSCKIIHQRARAMCGSSWADRTSKQFAESHVNSKCCANFVVTPTDLHQNKPESYSCHDTIFSCRQ